VGKMMIAMGDRAELAHRAREPGRPFVAHGESGASGRGAADVVADGRAKRTYPAGVAPAQ
jgi:hypothetical protein